MTLVQLVEVVYPDFAMLDARLQVAVIVPVLALLIGFVTGTIRQMLMRR